MVLLLSKVQLLEFFFNKGCKLPWLFFIWKKKSHDFTLLLERLFFGKLFSLGLWKYDFIFSWASTVFSPLLLLFRS